MECQSYLLVPSNNPIIESKLERIYLTYCRELYITNFVPYTLSPHLQDPKLTDKLCNKHGDNLEEKSLTICSGTDYINVNYQHIVCPDAETAKVCLSSFFVVSFEFVLILDERMLKKWGIEYLPLDKVFLFTTFKVCFPVISYETIQFYGWI